MFNSFPFINFGTKNSNFSAHLNFPLESLREWLESIRDKFPHLLCPKSNLLITCDRRGVLILDRNVVNGNDQNLSLEFVGPPEILAEEIVSVSGAGDWYINENRFSHIFNLH